MIAEGIREPRMSVQDGAVAELDDVALAVAGVALTDRADDDAEGGSGQ